MANKDLNIRLGLIFDERSLSKVENQLRRSGEKLSRLGDALTLSVSAPLAALGAGSIKAAGDLQSLTLALESQLGSAEAAKKEFAALTEAAKNPGIGLEEAVRASVRLQGVKFSAEEARGTILELGNALASTGGTAADLERVTRQFAQMTSKGRVLQEDISIISESMPAISGLMQKAFGTANVEAIREMGVGGKEFVLAITEAAKELPRVQGGIKNSIGNALDAIKQSAAKVGEAINSAFDIAGTAESFGNFLVGLAQGFSSLNPAVQSFVVYLGAALVAAGPLAKVFGAMTLLSAQLTSVWKGLVSAGSFVVDVFTKVNYAAGAIKWGNVITLVAGLAAAFYGLYQVTRDTDEVSQSFAKSQAEITKQTASEVGALNAAFAILKDETKSRVEKGEVIDKLLAQYPGYLKGIDLENASVKKLTEVQKALNAEILRGVAERQKASAVTAIYEKQAAILLRIQQIRDGASVTAGESLLIDTGDLIRTGSRATAIIEKLQQQQAKLGDDAVRLAGQFDKAFGTFNASADQALAAEYAARDAYYASRDALDNKVVSTVKHTSSIKAQTKALKEQAEVINVTPDIANFDQLPTLPTPTSVTSEGQAGPTPQTVDTSNLQQYLSFAEQLGEVNTKFQESAIGFNTAFSETARLVQEQGTVMQQIMFGVADAVQEAALSGETSFKALAGAAVAAAAKVVRSWIQQGVAAAVAKALGSLPFPANIVAGGLAGGLAAAAFTKAIRAIGVPKFARGTNFAPGGLSLVGEQGPELMNVPRGAQIASNQRTNRLLNNMGGGGMTVSGELRGRGSELYAVIKSVESKNKRTT